MQSGSRLSLLTSGLIGVMWAGRKSKNPDCDDLFKAAEANDLHSINCLLNSGVSANTNEIAKVESSQNHLVPYRGWTPLHIAAFHGHSEATATLIKSGADVNATDKFRHQSDLIWQMLGTTNASPTSVLDGVDKIKTLRDQHFHSEVSEEFYLHSTPLHYAALKGNMTVVRQLLSNGADPSMRNYNGQTARDLATDNRVKSILEEKQRQLESPVMRKYVYG